MLLLSQMRECLADLVQVEAVQVGCDDELVCGTEEEEVILAAVFHSVEDVILAQLVERLAASVAEIALGYSGTELLSNPLQQDLGVRRSERQVCNVRIDMLDHFPGSQATIQRLPEFLRSACMCMCASRVCCFFSRFNSDS